MDAPPNNLFQSRSAFDVLHRIIDAFNVKGKNFGGLTVEALSLGPGSCGAVEWLLAYIGVGAYNSKFE